MDVGDDTATSDGHFTENGVELIVVAHSKLDVTGVDAMLLVVLGGVSSQLDNLGGEVLEDGSEVHWGTGTNTLSVVALAKKTMDTTHGEVESSTGGAALALASGGLASFTTTSHDDVVGCC